MPDDNDNDSQDVDVSDLETVTMSRAELNAQMAKARRGGEDRRQRQGQGQRGQGGSRLDRIEQALEKLTTTAAPEEERKPPAAAPNAGGKVDRLTSGGLVDIFNLTLDQVVHLGPEGLRKHHEENLAAARSRDGAPPIPRMSKRR